MSPIHGEIAQELEVIVVQNSDATVQEITDALVKKTGVATSVAAVRRALHRLGFSRKKRSLSQQNETSRTT